MKGKKLDLFNFFYSFAAVIILIGVIAKLLEWPSQDVLITLGLGIEAMVFGVASIKFIDKKEPEVSNKLEPVTYFDKSEPVSSLSLDAETDKVIPKYNAHKDEHTTSPSYHIDITALDSESEEIVQNAITNLTKNKTTLVIAHRLSTIHNADKIFVMKNGAIVSSGNHAHLIENCEEYKSLYQKQLK